MLGNAQNMLRLFPDRFVPILLATIVFATIFPVSGAAVPIARGVATGAVVLLFFLHGIRLPRKEVMQALANWRLHGAIFTFCFGVMPIAGALAFYAFSPVLPPLLALGLVYLGILPSTVQSATTASSMAGGNVAASVVAAALINLAGMLVSPALFALIAGEQGGFAFSSDMVVRIVSMLLLPFIVGQFAQRWLREWAIRHKTLTVQLDRSTIAIAVYVALSGAVVAGLWRTLLFAHVAWLSLALVLLLLLSFGGAWTLGRVLKLNRPDAISLLFAGAQKSVAVGAPMAAILFPPAQAGAILLPLIAFHVAQLVLSAWLASWLRSKGS
jgi:solute carrier family 10 (sodium/bile acid cotransporter), member 7